ncbi:hypothetical protein MTO96_032887 [Rhipicephalus appendiculatus]
MNVVSVLGNANSYGMPAFSSNVLLKRVVLAAPSTKILRLEAQSKREEKLVNQIEEANRDLQSCGDACEMRGESEKLKLENEKLKRQLQLQKSEFAAKLEKSREDLEQALHLNARLQEALASKVFASALFRILMGGRTRRRAEKRLKDVRKHLAQKFGDLRRK